MGIDKSTQHSKSSVASVEVQDRYTESHDNRSSSQIEHMLSEVDHTYTAGCLLGRLWPTQEWDLQEDNGSAGLLEYPTQ